MSIRIEKNKLNVKDYQSIRATTDWYMLEEKVVEKALKNDLFSICVYEEDKLIGIGRIIGDGFMYFYVQDVIVVPEYQKKGIGRIIMDNIEAYLMKVTNNNSFVGLMAAQGAKRFYEKYGYKIRSESKPGMFKVIKK